MIDMGLYLTYKSFETARRSLLKYLKAKWDHRSLIVGYNPMWSII